MKLYFASSYNLKENGYASLGPFKSINHCKNKVEEKWGEGGEFVIRECESKIVLIHTPPKSGFNWSKPQGYSYHV